MGLGFQEAAGDYLSLGTMADAFDACARKPPARSGEA
jgi:hypothetical protein